MCLGGGGGGGRGREEEKEVQRIGSREEERERKKRGREGRTFKPSDLGILCKYILISFYNISEEY